MSLWRISSYGIRCVWIVFCFGKFRYIAESEGRSANKEIEQYIKRCVAEFEKTNGKIEVQIDQP